MQSRKYKRGEVVFWEGDPGSSMYQIEWGSVGVYANYATSAQRELAILWRGDYFGEMGLIDHEDRSATVVILEKDTTLSRIDEAEFKSFLSENPMKVFQIMSQLCHKLRNVTQEYRDVCKTLREKVGTDDVDGSSELDLAQDERLVAIHDRVQAAGEAQGSVRG